MTDWRAVLRMISPNAPVDDLPEAEAKRRAEAYRVQYRNPRVAVRRAANKRARQQRRINRSRSS